MLEKLAAQEGFGDVLADGVKRASDIIAKGSEEFAIHAGGQELGMHDPRLMPAMASVYECDPAPGRHTSDNSHHHSCRAFERKAPTNLVGALIYVRRSQL